LSAEKNEAKKKEKEIEKESEKEKLSHYYKQLLMDNSDEEEENIHNGQWSYFFSVFLCS
jgi:hypothetical protein